MTEDQKEQIRSMLLDIIDNSPKPENFEGSQADFKRDWLFTVADVAADEAGKVKA